METQNITLSIPKKVLRKIKLIAVQRETSVSGLLTHYLEEIVLREEGYARARDDHKEWLNSGANLGTGGHVSWKREELHER
jgi:hypothetical protein